MRLEDAAPFLRLRLHMAPGVTYDAAAGVLLVPRRGRLERLLARLMRRGDPRLRLVLDERARAVFDLLAADAATGRDVAVHLGIDPDADGDPQRAALVVFLAGLVRGGSLVAEPI